MRHVCSSRRCRIGNETTFVNEGNLKPIDCPFISSSACARFALRMFFLKTSSNHLAFLKTSSNHLDLYDRMTLGELRDLLRRGELNVSGRRRELVHSMIYSFASAFALRLGADNSLYISCDFRKTLVKRWTNRVQNFTSRPIPGLTRVDPICGHEQGQGLFNMIVDAPWPPSDVPVP